MLQLLYDYDVIVYYSILRYITVCIVYHGSNNGINTAWRELACSSSSDSTFHLKTKGKKVADRIQISPPLAS